MSTGVVVVTRRGPRSAAAAKLGERGFDHRAFVRAEGSPAEPAAFIDSGQPLKRLREGGLLRGNALPELARGLPRPAAEAAPPQRAEGLEVEARAARAPRVPRRVRPRAPENGQ